MTVDPLHLQVDSTQVLRTVRYNNIAGLLHRLAIGGRMRDAVIPRNALRQVNSLCIGHAFGQLLYAFMRVPEAYFQVNDRLARHTEPEVAGLDDARVNRADGYLEHAFALHLFEVVFCRNTGDSGRKVEVLPERV